MVVSDKTSEDKELNNYYSTLDYIQRNSPRMQKRLMKNLIAK